jgi:hypothetical protein
MDNVLVVLRNSISESNLYLGSLLKTKTVQTIRLYSPQKDYVDICDIVLFDVAQAYKIPDIEADRELIPILALETAPTAPHGRQTLTLTVGIGGGIVNYAFLYGNAAAHIRSMHATRDSKT